MEPVSLLSAAAAISAVTGKAWELGSFISEICQGAKTVDSRVRRLESAVNELARACEHVQGQFETMSSKTASKTPTLAWDEHGALTTSIENQVKDCRRTLRELRKLVIDLRTGSLSFFGRSARHIKLQDRGQQINDFSMRVKAHTDALQMSLQVVIIKIAHATPDFLLRQLATALDDLRARLSRIENNASPSASRTALRETCGAPLLEHARDALRSGTTLYEASTAGSVADAVLVADNERAARIKEWADKIDALRGDQNDNGGIHRQDTVSAISSVENDADNEVAGDALHPSSPKTLLEASSEGQSTMGPDEDSITPARAAHDSPLAGNEETQSVSELPIRDAPMKLHLDASDDTDHTSTDNDESIDWSSYFVPGDSSKPASLSPSSSCFSTTCFDEFTGVEPFAKPTNFPVTTDQSDTLDQCASYPIGISSEDADKAKCVPFRYPMGTSDPLDPSARQSLMVAWEIQTKGKLEAMLCSGDRIEPDVLSELVIADENPSADHSPSSESELQQKRKGIALELAVYFRDVYLIKPLVKLGFSPNAEVRLRDKDTQLSAPIRAAICIRSEPVIRELLESGATLPYNCTRSTCHPLLHPQNLRLFPPTSIGSVKSVIDLLMPASSFIPVACVCERQFTRGDGTCNSLQDSLCYDAIHMPADLSHYRMPLVTHLLEYLVSDGMKYRYTFDTPLCNAVSLGSKLTVKLLLKTADEGTVRSWLRQKNSEGQTPLYEAIELAVAEPQISLDIVRSLLDKGANLESIKWAKPGFLHNTYSPTARQCALRSGRADLIALVREHDSKIRTRSAQSQTST